MDQVEFDYEEGRVDRSSAPLEPNPFDLNALEEAVKYKEELGGEVIAISMGPKQAESTLKDAIARGADEGILLQGREFAGSDTWATSLALGHAIEAVGDFDLIFSGEKTVDGDTGQVGPEVAEFLNIPHIAFVSGVKARKEDEVEVVSESWGATYVKSMELPGLITLTKDVNEPRLPSFKDKQKARKAKIANWGVEDIGIDQENLGITGSPTRVANMEVPPPEKRESMLLREDPGSAVNQLLEKLDLGRSK
ncbi:electron transfer flavoprotein subunit beta/FixA family protein [Candidatus Bipolaricaulota bacterium]|nr:electron transfer flavoprotein subunit beta/FixA family protein [Candidatus Bipolaricaulota bacterium]MBS3792868.1 electron transfer flavoprotein subunit beta/FixA family protein [Candidatus Bipolaricaulota bacterium]